MTPDELKAKGWQENADGTWSKPNRAPVGGSPATQPEPDPVRALVKSPQACRGGKGGVVVRVTLIRCGLKLFDGDNLAAAFKGTRDAIAFSLQVDDADPRVEWTYGQVGGVGKGTIVKIELL